MATTSPKSFLRSDMTRKMMLWPPCGVHHITMTAQSCSKFFSDFWPKQLCSGIGSLSCYAKFNIKLFKNAQWWFSQEHNIAEGHQWLYKNPQSQEHVLCSHKQATAHKHESMIWHRSIDWYEYAAAHKHGNTIWYSPIYSHKQVTTHECRSTIWHIHFNWHNCNAACAFVIATKWPLATGLRPSWFSPQYEQLA